MKEEKQIKNMLDGMLYLAKKERESSEPYKEMFKAGANYEGLLRQLEHKMISEVLDAGDVLHNKGFKVRNEVFYFLLSLPLRVKILEKEITEKEGYVCSFDKTYYLLARELEELLNAKENQ